MSAEHSQFRAEIKAQRLRRIENVNAAAESMDPATFAAAIAVEQTLGRMVRLRLKRLPASNDPFLDMYRRLAVKKIELRQTTSNHDSSRSHTPLNKLDTAAWRTLDAHVIANQRAIRGRLQLEELGYDVSGLSVDQQAAALSAVTRREAAVATHEESGLIINDTSALLTDLGLE